MKQPGLATLSVPVSPWQAVQPDMLHYEHKHSSGMCRKSPSQQMHVSPTRTRMQTTNQQRAHYATTAPAVTVLLLLLLLPLLAVSSALSLCSSKNFSATDMSSGVVTLMLV